MADVKFPNIAANNSFVVGNAGRTGGLDEYHDNSALKNDNRSQSFHSGRGGTGNCFGGKNVTSVKRQRKE